MAVIRAFTNPLSLYRYRSLSSPEKLENEINAILENYLWSFVFDKLNDPMEGSYFPSSILKKSSRYNEIKSKIYDQKSAIGICSFSETHDNDLMWAHYADQFSGICISYLVEDLLKSLSDSVDLVCLFYNEKVPRLHIGKKTDDEITKKIGAVPDNAIMCYQNGDAEEPIK